MADDQIRVGIVGAGSNTTGKHIPGLQAIGGVEIVTVCNRSRDSSQRVADQFGIPSIDTSWMDLVTSENVDAVVIGTWPYMHCRVTLAALAADKHVMCEARMAKNAGEARQMLAAAQARPDLVAQIVPSPMTLGVDRTVKRLIAEGYLGEILAVDVRAGGSFLDPGSPLHWRQDFDLSGYNILSMGIWYEAIMRWLGQATSVAAMGKTFVKMRQGDDGFMHSTRIPEHLDVIAGMACGAQLHMQISAVTGLSGAPEVFLFGAEGTLRFSQGKLFGGRRDDDSLQEVSIPAAEQGGWRVEEEFVNAIRGQEAITHTSFEDGVKYMEFTEAVTRSMASGNTVSVPL